MGCKGLEEEEKEEEEEELSGAMLEEWAERQPMNRRKSWGVPLNPVREYGVAGTASPPPPWS
jgi:hypothetical protein